MSVCASQCWPRTMNYFTLENEIKEVMNIVTEEAGERQTGPVLSQRSLPPPNAFPEPHKLCGILNGPARHSGDCLSLFQYCPFARTLVNTPLSRHRHLSTVFSYMLNLSASGLMSPCLHVPGCVVWWQRCWVQSCQGNAVLDLQLGCFAPQWGQLASS